MAATARWLKDVKRVRSGSVEKSYADENHDVVGEDFQSQLPALTPGSASSDKGFEVTFEHRDHRFDLDTIAIRSEVEAGLHQPSIVAGSRLLDWPASTTCYN